MFRSLPLLFIGLALGASLWAQSFFQPFNVLETRTCPFDSTIQVAQPPNWVIYQTQDDRSDGPPDSTRCISATLSNGRVNIPVSSIDAGKPVFIRCTLPTDDVQRVLTPGSPYHFYLYIGSEGGLSLNDSLNCPEGVCTGLLLSVALPNETGDSTIVRKDVLAQTATSGNTYCFATENVPNLRLEDIVIKVTPNNQTGFIKLSPLEIYPYPEGSFARIEGLIFPASQANPPNSGGYLYEVVQPPGQWIGLGAWVVSHNGATYPGAPPVQYVEAQTTPPTSEPHHLALFIESDALLFQPYTALRGALVEGSDNLRHQLDIYFAPYADLCGLLIVDLMIDAGTRFVFSDGEIGFANNTSCLMLANGGELQVSEGGHLLYGNQGIGLLGLFNRGMLRLEPHSTLKINTRVSLLGQGPYQYGYVDLQPGSRLIFGEHSGLDRQNPNSGMRLKVLMNGGAIDDSQLTPDERALIERIYPDLPQPQPGAVTVFPNPATNYLRLALNAHFPDGPAQWELIDTNGRKVAGGRLAWSVYEGAVTLPDLSLPKGIYRIRVMQGEHVAQGSVMWLGE